ncbi:hypothetical protein [Streptomyces sp. NPDC047000]|uniref:hypothetical protein n=1 Tax=Streptomyces sp. NPDC047000 TaxID=3155474 RepID=UPI0033D991A3
MRLSTPLSACLAAAAALLPTTATAAPAVVAPAASGTVPDCADGSRTFPLTTRIHDGPATYGAHGEPGTWYLDLTNTTGRPCTAVHPVVVLTDTGRTLRADQVHMVFHDGPRAHPVRFEATDEAELVGAFDDGFPGFTVGPGRTVTVEVTLAFTADADVTLKAAVVRRRGDDGDWIGQSDDYRFGVGTGSAPAVPEPDPEARPDPDPGSARPSAPDPTAASATSAASAVPAASVTSAAPAASVASAAPAVSVVSPVSGNPTATAFPSAVAEAAQQLARTGLGSAQRAALALAAMLVTMGSVLLLLRRRR